VDRGDDARLPPAWIAAFWADILHGLRLIAVEPLTVQTAGAKPANVLAVLAIGLQVIVCSLGGRLCVRTAPFPQESGCASQCCGEEDGPAPNVVIVDAVLPLLPVSSDCCIEQQPEYLAPTDQPDLPGVLVATLSTLPPDGGLASVAELRPIAAASRRAAHPPPALVIVRTTILRI
jgi:hypothetical protein